MNFWEILVLFFSFQSLVIGVLFFIKRSGDLQSNLFLGIFLLLFSYSLFFGVLNWTHFDYRLFTALTFTGLIPVSLFGPCFYLYLRRVVTFKSMGIKDIIHLIPFFVVLFKYHRFYGLSFEAKIDVLKNQTQMDFVFDIPGLYLLLICCLLGYGVFSYKIFIRKYNEDAEMAIWLKAISISFLLFALAHLTYYFLVFSGLLKINMDYLISFVAILAVALTVYFSFAHNKIFNGVPVSNMVPFTKYQKSSLTPSLFNDLSKELVRILEEERLYKKDDLSLDELSKYLGTSRHNTSQIINENFGLSFFELMNHLRIGEALNILSKDKIGNLKVKEIGYDCGYNNKSTFHKAFKRVTGITPNEFRNLPYQKSNMIVENIREKLNIIG